LDSETLALALASHSNLRGVAQRIYADDNIDAMSSMLLTSTNCGFQCWRSAPPESDCQDYRDGVSHQWNQENISRVAAMKNRAIEVFLKSDYTHLFLVDSDVILHPATVEHLLSLDLPIVSEVFWTKWMGEQDVWAPQVWDIHPYAHSSVENIIRLRVPGQYEVGGLGACTLIRRDVLEAIHIPWQGAFTPIPSVSMEGEDRHFCIRASAHGFGLFADTHYPPFHVYRKSQLEEAVIWLGAGAPPEYFRETWLTDEWTDELRSREKQQLQIHRSGGVSRRLAICLPGEVFSTQYLTNILSLYEYALSRFDVRVFHGYSSDASMTRWALTNELLSHYEQKPPDYVLWVDDDNVVCSDALKLLVEDLEAYPQLDIVAGWCICSTGSTSVGMFDELGYMTPLTEEEITSSSELRSIGWTGCPCVLMRGQLLSNLGASAWVRMPDKHGKLPWGYFGEDASFCKRAITAGAKLAVDPRVKVPHLKTMDLNTNQAASRPQETKKEETVCQQQ
jgi:hypothetical protein